MPMYKKGSGSKPTGSARKSSVSPAKKRSQATGTTSRGKGAHKKK